MVAMQVGIVVSCVAHSNTLSGTGDTADLFVHSAPLSTLRGVHLGMQQTELRHVRPAVFLVPYSGLGEDIDGDTIVYWFKPEPIEATDSALLSRPQFDANSPLIGLFLQERVVEGDSVARVRWAARVHEIALQLGKPLRCGSVSLPRVPMLTAEWQYSGATVVAVFHPKHNYTPQAPTPLVEEPVIRILYAEHPAVVYPSLRSQETVTCPQ